MLSMHLLSFSKCVSNPMMQVLLNAQKDGDSGNEDAGDEATGEEHAQVHLLDQNLRVQRLRNRLITVLGLR